MKLFAALLFLAAFSFGVPKIVVKDPWVREVPPVSTMSAAFMEIYNEGDEDDYLIGVETDVARVAELHTTIMEGGMMRMRKLEKVKVPAKGKVSFKPMGKHIMLIDLKKVLRAGEKVKLTLIFKKSGRVEVQAPVRRGMMMMH